MQGSTAPGWHSRHRQEGDRGIPLYRAWAGDIPVGSTARTIGLVPEVPITGRVFDAEGKCCRPSMRGLVIDLTTDDWSHRLVICRPPPSRPPSSKQNAWP